MHEAVREEFVARLAAQVERDVGLGDRSQTRRRAAPLSRPPRRSWRRTLRTRSSAARWWWPAARGPTGFPTSLYWPATILDRVPPDSIAATQETFGPIAPIVSIGSIEEAIEQTNSQAFGLMAAIFTRDVGVGLRFADSVHMGLVNINETTNYWEAHLPWGGRGRSESGIGRVGGRYPMETLTELQTVLIRSEPA